MTVKFKLAEVRKRRGYSQGDLAKATGMTAANIQHLERRSKAVPHTTLNILCNVLGCTPGDLFEYTPDTDAGDASELLTSEKDT
ncbi:MAG: helix-turn-helix transcriptional regulator [Oscillatoria princeps RMCB-10]|jgi:putative transcriptional regulator|nr:helix-turn-helix transcriptional regulator [Oscillatoria princeps RMCB-10]